MARVDHHISRRRHVTARALRTGAARGMMMMGRLVETRRRVTLPADRVALCAQLAAVWFVTVAAGHACRVHPALEKRSPVVDFVSLLAVRIIERRG